MKKRILGKTGILAPEIGMGCWPIGGSAYGAISEEDALATLQKAWECGVRFFDTADVYGEGRSESLIAKFLQTIDRDEMIIATKAGWDFYRGVHRKNFEPEYLWFSLEESLRRLNTTYIDLYQLHNPSLGQIQSGEAIDTLLAMKKKGKIGHIGISVHTEEEALAALKDERVESLQVIFNMLDQRMSKNVFYLARVKKVAILAREPLACGLLTGKYSAASIFEKNDHRRRYSMEKLAADCEKIDKIKNFIEPRLTIAQAALEFVLSEPAVSVVIPGAKTSQQISQNCNAIHKPFLTAEAIRQIKNLFETDPLFRQHLLPS